MKWIFEYSHPQHGTVTGSQPEGWAGTIIGFTRAKDYYSLLEFFKTTLNAFGNDGARDGRRDWFKDVKRLYGVAAQITMTVKYSRDGRSFATMYTGILPVIMFVENIADDHHIVLSPAANGLWQKMISRFENSVNIESPTAIDGEEVNMPERIALNFLSQVLDQYAEYVQDKYWNYGRMYDSSEVSPDFQVEISNNGIAGVDMTKEVKKEITTRYSIPIAPIPNGDRVFPMYVLDYGGQYDIDIKIAFTLLRVSTGEPHLTQYRDLDGWLKVFIQINDEIPVEFIREDKEVTFVVPPTSLVQTNRWSEFSFNALATLGAKTTIRIWVQNTSGGNFGYAHTAAGVINLNQLYMLGTVNGFPMQDALNDLFPGDLLFPSTPYRFYKFFNKELESFIRIVGHTVFDPTVCPGFLIHDVGGAIAERITGVKDCFYSEFLGNLRTSLRTYGAVGCGSNTMQLKGLQLRGYTLEEKPFFGSMKAFWEGWNAVYNLGMSHERKVIEGVEQDVIQIEEKAKYFDASSMSIVLLNIRRVSMTYDKELHFTDIQHGFEKWESENASGIDDSQTKRTLNTVLGIVGRSWKMFSKIICASLTIETTRRKSKDKSADYKFDNEDFGVALVEEGLGYKPQTNEGFTDVENLSNADTRYNKIFTVYRNLIRWLNFISVGLQDYLGSTIKFGSGEGNFDMVSTLTDPCGGEYSGVPVSEKSDLAVTGNPLFVATPITIVDHPMGMEEYLHFQKNRHLAIGISQTESNVAEAFVFNLEYRPVDGLATFVVCPRFRFELKTPRSIGNTGLPYTRIFDSSFGPDFE